MRDGFNLLSEGFGLTREQRSLIVRVGWVGFVSGHIAWVCGFLGPFGLASPFAKAGDVEQLKQATTVAARLQITQELRVQQRAWCATKDQTTRDAIASTLDKLREEYQRISGEKPPEQRCDAS